MAAYPFRPDRYRQCNDQDGLTGAVGAALLPVAPALDLLIGNLSDLMGLHVGQADVTINGVRCGGAVLVA